MFTNLNLSDMETCYKVIKLEFFQKLKIQENRFGIEPEITGKLAALGARFYEVSIKYIIFEAIIVIDRFTLLIVLVIIHGSRRQFAWSSAKWLFELLHYEVQLRTPVI